jgi:hypothetical protein
MQVLSCSSAGALVAISGLLVRSQALVSGARSPNFEATNPSVESSHISTEILPVIILLIMLLMAPAIIAIILASKSRFKKAFFAKDIKDNYRENMNESGNEGSIQESVADVRLCLATLTQKWQRWRGRKVVPQHNFDKVAAVLASAAIFHSKKRGNVSAELEKSARLQKM